MTNDQLRRWINRKLHKMGFRRQRASGGSDYYHLGHCINVRVSDHEVPMTAEREWNSAFNGGFTWANTDLSHVLTTQEDAAVWIDEIRKHADSYTDALGDSKRPKPKTR